MKNRGARAAPRIRISSDLARVAEERRTDVGVPDVVVPGVDVDEVLHLLPVGGEVVPAGLPVVVAVQCLWKDVHHRTITTLSPRNIAAAASVVVPYRTNHDPDLDARHPPNEAPIGTMTRPLIDEAVGDMIIPLDDATKVVSLLWNGTAEIETLRSTVGRGPCPWSADETTFQGKNDLLEESNHLLSPTASHTKRIHLRVQIQPWGLSRLLPLAELHEG